jgi:hypothetical protein
MKSRKAPKVAIASSSSIAGNEDPRPSGLSLEEIRLRAYEIYVERGTTDGQDLEEWFQAEKELTENIRERQSA